MKPLAKYASPARPHIHLIPATEVSAAALGRLPLAFIKLSCALVISEVPTLAIAAS